MYAQEHIKPYSNTDSKKNQVENMFNNIAHSYDRLNHLLSFGVDRKWRKSALDYLQKQCNPSIILDVATGTGDFAILANKKLNPQKIVGIDISEKMLELARTKVASANLSDIIHFRQEDCKNLSFNDNHFDAIITSFALRNFEDLDVCLSEMYRVLRPGGIIVAIDLCSPLRPPMRQLFWCYKKILMPTIGHTISHDKKAYSYLPDTMDAVPQGKEMMDIFSKAGFKDVYSKRLTFQMCMLYSGKKNHH